MTTKLKWRLSKLPDAEEITTLVAAGILTKEEAREILISHENDEERDKKSLQDEIKFLRELVQKLSSDRATIIKTIEVVKVPYQTQPWYQPYIAYCSSTPQQQYINAGGGGGGSTSMQALYTANANTVYSTTSTNDQLKFTDIKTF